MTRWLTIIAASLALGFAVSTWLSNPEAEASGSSAPTVPLRWVSTEKPVALGHGATFVKATFRADHEVTVSLVLFDETQCTLRVVDQPDKRRDKQGMKGKTLAQACAGLGAIAGCNGGYFKPDFGPHGLQVADGVRIETDIVPNMGNAGGAIVVRAGGKPELIVDTTFKDGSDVSQFVQCAPLFIVNGKPIADMSGGQRAPRTFVLRDKQGRWAIGTASSMGLQEMSDALRTPQLLPGWSIDMALNLDGGPSTGLWWREAGGQAHDTPPAWPVRNYVVVVPRN